MKSNESILIARDKALQFYKMYEKIWIGMAKFISIILVLVSINRAIGYAPTFTNSYVIAVIALISVLLPAHYMMLMIMGIVTVHLMTLNLIIGSIALLVFLCIYILFIRLYPKESLLIIVTMMVIDMKLLYVLPILAGLFGGFGAIVAILIGIVGRFSFASLEMMIQSILKAEDIMVWIKESLNLFMAQTLYNTDLLATLSVCLVVFSLVYIIKRQVIDYAPYIAIAIGGVMNILGFTLAALFLNVPIHTFLLVSMTIISVIIAVIIEFISKPVDYSRSEAVQFEDEDNYYIVKVIPKIQVRKSSTKVEKVYIPPSRVQEESVEE